MPEGLSDEKTIQAIQENPYMQYLLGLPKFTENPVFVPELFVQIRKRLDHEFFNLLTMLLSEADGSKPKKVHTNEDGNDHGGTMKVDATCCDAEVRYPTDYNLMEDGSELISRPRMKTTATLRTRRGPSARGTRWRPHSEPPKGFTGQTTSGRNLTTRLTHG